MQERAKNKLEEERKGLKRCVYVQENDNENYNEEIEEERDSESEWEDDQEIEKTPEYNTLKLTHFSHENK